MKSILSKMKQAYRQQRSSAYERGIEWELSFQEWISWWEEQLGSDWWMKRGCRRGQYVVARYNDTGSYRLGNIKCITAEENHIEYNQARKQPTPKVWLPPLDRDIVVAIYLDEGGPTALSQKYGVTKHKVYCIKTQRYFKLWTDPLKG